MRAVNLLPRDLESSRDFGGRTPMLVAAGGIAAVTAAAVVLFMSASGSVSDQTSQVESLEAAIASVPSPNQPAVAPAGITQERADRVAAFSAALTYRVPLDRLLRELAYVLPEDAWLTGLTAAGSPSSAVATAPAAATTVQGVTIQGATYSQASVARVLARFGAIPSLDHVRLTASARIVPAAPQPGQKVSETKGKKKRTVVTFTIAADLGSGTP
jgi:Tfp pilus assembly protein PilN